MELRGPRDLLKAPDEASSESLLIPEMPKLRRRAQGVAERGRQEGRGRGRMKTEKEQAQSGREGREGGRSLTHGQGCFGSDFLLASLSGGIEGRRKREGRPGRKERKRSARKEDSGTRREGDRRREGGTFRLVLSPLGGREGGREKERSRVVVKKREREECRKGRG